MARGTPLARAKELANDTWVLLMARQREGKLRALKLPAFAFQQAMWLPVDDARRERGGMRHRTGPSASGFTVSYAPRT